MDHFFDFLYLSGTVFLRIPPLLMSDRENVTKMLQDFTEGKIQSAAVLPYIYQELRTLARSQRRRYSPGETLNTTALVHEAYLKLINHSHQNWETRSHFFSVAAKAMRSIIINHAKMHKTAKRGGGEHPVPLHEELIGGKEKAGEILDLDEALSLLEKIAERQSKVVELRFFCGFTIEETANILSTSPTTVKRDWNFARSWLYREIQNGNS